MMLRQSIFCTQHFLPRCHRSSCRKHHRQVRWKPQCRRLPRPSPFASAGSQRGTLPAKAMLNHADESASSQADPGLFGTVWQCLARQTHQIKSSVYLYASGASASCQLIETDSGKPQNVSAAHQQTQCRSLHWLCMLRDHPGCANLSFIAMLDAAILMPPRSLLTMPNKLKFVHLGNLRGCGA